MNSLWSILYSFIFIPLFYFSLKVIGLFNSKIRTGLRERKYLFDILQKKIRKIDPSKKNLWFHSSSVGEFEQAKPIIEKLKLTNKYNIIVTFFSPSGYHSAKRHELADIISYLPLDFKSHIRRYLKLVNPSALIIMRYDIWPNSIFETFKKNIPIFLVDATMKKHSLRKSWLVKNLHRQIFSCFKKILTVSSVDSDRFAKFGFDISIIEEAGDTRYDRVYMKSQEALTKKIIPEKILENKSVFVAGSTWREDEEVLFPALLKLHEYEKNLISIIVPHEPTIQNLEIIEYELNQQLKTIRFSYLTQYNGEKIIIIDSVGILLSLYAYANVAFVGGGFHSNVHNVLEPAVYGIPVIFGPKHLSSQEAEKLIKAGGGFEVKDKFELYRLMRNFFIDEKERMKAGEASRTFVQSNIGATEKIINTLNQFL